MILLGKNTVMVEEDMDMVVRIEEVVDHVGKVRKDYIELKDKSCN